MWFCQFPAFIFFCDTFFLRLTSSFGHNRRDGFALLFLLDSFERTYGFRFEEFESCHPNYGELFLPTKSCVVCVCMIKQCFTLGGIIYPTNLYVFTMHSACLINPRRLSMFYHDSYQYFAALYPKHKIRVIMSVFAHQ